MDWSGTKVLVTGAGGFIGSHLSEVLVELGAEVTALIRYTSRSDLMDVKKQIILDDERLRPEKSEVFELICNSEKAVRLLGWKPDYSLRAGLSEAIAFVSEQLHQYKPTTFSV